MSGYFTVHLPSFWLMHVHWSIDNEMWEKIVSNAVADVYGDPVLFIRIMKLHGTQWILDQQIDVFGKNNHWIVSIGDHLHGSAIKVMLVTAIEGSGEETIFESDAITLPLSPENMKDTIPTFTKEIHAINAIDKAGEKRVSS
ncbi:MAG: hypothetical protein N3F66_07470 [Spirochaetes bacterium]|nr:hypothetical protein [Spirochaetota bacterium]